MQWNDEGIVLSARRLGESAAVVHLLTPQHGMHAGVDRFAFSRRKQGLYQAGNAVSVSWKARMSEQLGTVSCELMHSIAPYVLDDRRKLAALTSATLMTEKILSERDPQPVVFEAMESFLHKLRADEDWLAAYVLLEYTLLEHAGFGLDLASCAATGQAHDLTYVSPKSGRAVSADAGKPYHSRLLALPEFLISATSSVFVDLAQILDGVRLCGYFLQERVFVPRGVSVPAVRERFVKMLDVGERALAETAT